MGMNPGAEERIFGTILEVTYCSVLLSLSLRLALTAGKRGGAGAAEVPCGGAASPRAQGSVCVCASSVGVTGMAVPLLCKRSIRGWTIGISSF